MTLRPGESLQFTNSSTCPQDPCTYTWDLGNGTTSTAATPPVMTFSQPGYYSLDVVRLDGTGASVSTTAHVMVWSGSFVDSFARPSLSFKVDGWLPPVDPSISWAIVNDWLYVAPHDQTFPGSTGLLAAPLVHNGHVEATVRRHPGAGDWHYTDILLRQHPRLWQSSFYRIRIFQAPSGEEGGMLQLAVFRIDPTTDQHGILLNDRGQALSQGTCAVSAECPRGDYLNRCIEGVCRPVQPVDVPRIAGWNPGRDQDIRVVADLYDIGGVPTFSVKFVNPTNASDVFLEQTFTDGLPDPLTYTGLWGLTTFRGDAYFDNFLLQERR